MLPLSNLKFFQMCDYSANIHKHFQNNQIKQYIKYYRVERNKNSFKKKLLVKFQPVLKCWKFKMGRSWTRNVKCEVLYQIDVQHKLIFAMVMFYTDLTQQILLRF